MQGVVDAAMVEPDGITVIDFKTDRVSEAGAMQRAEHYRPPACHLQRGAGTDF